MLVLVFFLISPYLPSNKMRSPYSSKHVLVTFVFINCGSNDFVYYGSLNETLRVALCLRSCMHSAN